MDQSSTLGSEDELWRWGTLSGTVYLQASPSIAIEEKAGEMRMSPIGISASYPSFVICCLEGSDSVSFSGSTDGARSCPSCSRVTAAKLVT